MPSSVKALGQARPSGAGMAPQTRCCSLAAVQRRLPILAWLPNYSLRWLKMDLVAGLSVGLTVVPQALAYAEVAGLPPQVRSLRLPHPHCSRCPEAGGNVFSAPWGPRNLGVRSVARDGLWAGAGRSLLLS